VGFRGASGDAEGIAMTTQDVLKNAVVIVEFAKSKKPTWTTPLANLLIVELLLVTDATGKTGVGIEWLCQRTGASRSTIARTLCTLCKKGWVVKLSGKQNYRTNTYSVQVNYLPIHYDTKRSVVGAEAQTLAMYYHGLVKALPKIETKNGRMRSVRVARDWDTHWGRTAQDWLDEGFDAEHIKDVIDKAFQTKSWSYCHGLQTLKTEFLRLLQKAGWRVVFGGEEKEDAFFKAIDQFPDGCVLSVK
jgi:hypothetical protein